CFKLRVEPTDDHVRVLDFGGAAPRNGFHFTIDQDKTARFGFVGGAVNAFDFEPYLGRTVHIATLYDPQSQMLVTYVDGRQMGQTPVPGPQNLNPRGGLRVAMPPPATERFAGLFGDLRLYNRAVEVEKLRRIAGVTDTATPPTDSPTPGAADLLAHYRFDAADGNRIQDRSDNGKHARLHGAVLREGKFGQAVETTGNNSYVAIPALAESLDEATFAVWFRTDEKLGTWGSIFQNNEWKTGSLHINSKQGIWQVGIHTASGPHKDVVSEFNLNDHVGRWVHLAFTYERSSGKVRLFVNGKMLKQDTIEANTPLNIGPGAIGAWLNKGQPTRPTQARYDEMRFYGRVLSDAQIEALAAPPDTGLIAHWPLDKDFKDVVGQHHAQLFGNGRIAPAGGSDRKVLDLSGGHVRIPPGFADFTQGGAIAAWVRATSVVQWARIVGLGDGPHDKNILLARNDQTDDIVLHMYGEDGDTQRHRTLIARDALPLNRWVHVAASFAPDGPNVLYINGAEADRNPDPWPIPNETRNNNYLGKSN
ncbi:MAG: LamG-like jellyroll fold domain-containing protein, partial [Phycisphaeraceae bacterium]|nr:LamG-like jellyroll fold domain-containing protein [Phycisphaeraceae bacterium]